MNLINKIFDIQTESEFSDCTLEVFKFQANNNPVYKKYLSYLNLTPQNVKQIQDIPFLPIEFFKTRKIISGNQQFQKVFKSSGTSGVRSNHFVKDISIYKTSLLKSFQTEFEHPNSYCFLALLPNYLEQGDSSLIFMINELMGNSSCKFNGFYLNDFLQLSNILKTLEKKKIKTILWGVGYALLDFGEFFSYKLKNTIIIETGGMKGKRKEITRKELHKKLKKYYGVNIVHAEYGMTELLSQAYCHDSEKFLFPPWAKALIRDIYDPFNYLPYKKRGGINIIDLANIYSCSFIETQDIGLLNEDNAFEVIGRIDNSDLRGCSLLLD